MGFHKSGRNDTTTPGASCDLTLADYINRKSKHDALISSKPKMTLDEWYALNKWRWEFGFDVPLYVDSIIDEALEICWNASRENM